MPWPYIFFKAAKKGESPEQPPAIQTPPEATKPAASESQPPAIKPVPTIVPTKTTPTLPTPLPPEPKPETATSTRTLPAMHGVVLRPPGRLTASTGNLPGGGLPPPRATEPLKNMEELMAEADPTHTLNQTSGLPVVKRLAPGELPPPLTPPVSASSNLPKQTFPPPPNTTKTAPTADTFWNNAPTTPAPVATKSTPIPSSAILPPPKPPSIDPATIPPPFPSFRPASLNKPEIKIPEPKKIDPPPVPSPMVKSTVPLPPSPPRISTAGPITQSLTLPSAPAPTPAATAKSDIPLQVDSPFILKPAVAPVATTKTAAPIPPPPPPQMPLGVFSRKAKMTEVARIVLPPKREETQPLRPANETPVTSPTVVPPAFPVAAMTKRATQQFMTSKLATTMPMQTPRIVATKTAPPIKPPEPTPVPPPIPIVTQSPLPPPIAPTKIETSPELPSFDVPVVEPKTEVLPPVKAKSYLPQMDTSFDFFSPSTPPQGIVPGPMTLALFSETPKVDPEAHKPKPAVTPAPKVDPGAHKPEPIPTPIVPVTLEPKLDPEAHKPEASFASAPKADPEAHKPEPAPASTLPIAPFTPPSPPEPSRDRREFHLANGERIAGVVLSETSDSVLVQHAILGVISVPRNQIAKRLVEIILINGDRIVGDIMAETSDTLYVRHASLGMLTVPRAQRSTRVVEAILKDGDRILGEVLTETDSFTVIRSATLGTITVPHEKMAMLNRKIEQIEMQSLPPPPPELKDKSA